MLRVMMSVVAGFATMAALVMVGMMAIMATLVPGGMAAMKTMHADPSAMPAPTPRYYLMNLLLSLLAALAGGAVTGRLAGTQASGSLAALCGLVLVMGLVSAFSPGSGRQPAWYKIATPLLGALGVLLSSGLVGR
jgi:hypothetical protein